MVESGYQEDHILISPVYLSIHQFIDLSCISPVRYLSGLLNILAIQLQNDYLIIFVSFFDFLRIMSYFELLRMRRGIAMTIIELWLI